jgi:hypothetical protein
MYLKFILLNLRRNVKSMSTQEFVLSRGIATCDLGQDLMDVSSKDDSRPNAPWLDDRFA